jgi:hypothetical protein
MKSGMAEVAPGKSALDALAAGRHSNPFALLGPHFENDERLVRCLLPQATSVSMVDRKGKVIAAMERIHDGGIFAATCRGTGVIDLSIDRRRSATGISRTLSFPSTLGEL